MPFKVVTLNLTSDLSRWKLRRDLLADQLAELTPYIILLQEISLPENPTNWLSEQLNLKLPSNGYTVYMCPKTGRWGKSEGIGIIHRGNVVSHDCFPLGGQGRIAQIIQIQLNGQVVTLINTHLFWEPGHSEERIRQVRKLIDWSGEHSENLPVMICGDFNAPPDSHSIQLMKERYRSAYESVHHREPAYTYPTPLPVSPFHQFKTVIRFLPYIHLSVIRMDRHNVLDYIFVNHLIKVLDCNLVFDRSHPENKKIYASDHFGLFAEVSCTQ